MRFLLVLICLMASCTSAFADKAVFTFLKTVKVAELNEILDAERRDFVDGDPQAPGYVLPPASSAMNDVNLFTVRYYSRSPDLGGKAMVATGLLALPNIANPSNIPLISYQHGTVMGKYEVPSYAFRATNPSGVPHYAQAYETRYMVALFAGNGYALMAADNFGLGDAARFNQAYFIKQSAAQASFDLYRDVIKFLAARNIVPSKFMLCGWSEGGLNTTGFLGLLEALGVKVDAAFTAASPNDPYASFNATLFHPRAADTPIMPILIAFTAFSCENYLGPKGLAKSTIAPAYYLDMKSLYDRTYAGLPGLGALLIRWQGVPFTEFLRPTFRDPARFANSNFGRCLASEETYRREFKTPLRMYFGTVDELVRPNIALLARDYQLTITDTPDAPTSSRIEAYRIEGADHDLTFLSGAAAARAWIDTLH